MRKNNKMTIDLKLKPKAKSASKTKNYSVPVSEQMRKELYALPKEERHKKAREFFAALIAANKGIKAG